MYFMLKGLSVTMLWKTLKLQVTAFVFDKVFAVLGSQGYAMRKKSLFSLINKLLAYISCIIRPARHWKALNNNNK